jgi:ABC-type transport system involved in resistance to organic solvents, periplasmic component
MNLTERLNALTERVNNLTERVNDLTKRLNELTERVNDLTERLNALTERVNNLTERVNDLTERLNELAERVNELTKRVGELAEAQKRTDQKVEELAEAQKRTEQRVYELVGVLQKLTEEHRKTREKLEGLSDSFGYLLEDRAMKSLPKILKENYKIEVVEKLKRDYFVVDGEYVEVNIFGRAKKEDKEYILLGESKSRVSKKAIDAFLRKCDKISKRFSKEPIKVFVSYIFTPEIKEYAEEKGIILVPSYELEL